MALGIVRVLSDIAYKNVRLFWYLCIRAYYSLHPIVGILYGRFESGAEGKVGSHGQGQRVNLVSDE